MNFFVIACLIRLFVCVASENCVTDTDCKWTACNNAHGWWIHCVKGSCGCTHDTFTGVACLTGETNVCNAAHGDRCVRIGGAFHCLDNVCHCIKHNTDIGKK